MIIKPIATSQIHLAPFISSADFRSDGRQYQYLLCPMDRFGLVGSLFRPKNSGASIGGYVELAGRYPLSRDGYCGEEVRL